MDEREFLRRLSAAAGVSGGEGERAGLVLDALGPRCDEAGTDRYGNAVCLKKGKGRGRLMLAAHMDEVGLMVAGVDEGGFVHLTAVGGADAGALPAQEVTIHGREKVFGVAGAAAPAGPGEAEKSGIERVIVDVGLAAREVKRLVAVGDYVTVNSRYIELLGGKAAGKALDDAAGLTALAFALKYLEGSSHDWDVYFVATAQEETGYHGAKTAAYTIKPDIAIAIDVGFARTPELSDEYTCEADKGPQIEFGPNVHRRVFERLKESAKNGDVRHQIKFVPRISATDAGMIQISECGVATGVLAIPLKYMHSPLEVVEPDDVEAAGKLLAGFVMSLNGFDPEELLCF